ncbi:MAG: hypothetical protein GF388_11755, partial [Candidatus Aegiribacteria sp.]|nr:hypothetical protein [Candidatus Aegiribacteria sp.]
MRTLYTIFTIFTVSCVFPAIQADEIEEAREYYNDVMERLDDEYGLYKTEISINTEDGIYPAIGNYQETITFYWGAEGGYEWLVLVIWTGEYASRRTYGEILYEPQAFLEDRKEEVVFQYVSDLDWDGNTTEYQW